ncbi:MAG: hypothetical protein LIP16_20585 [Clostridium sp.]|nr:hypothetical protein [Clostridium sp.]
MESIRYVKQFEDILIALVVVGVIGRAIYKIMLLQGEDQNAANIWKVMKHYIGVGIIAITLGGTLRVIMTYFD